MRGVRSPVRGGAHRLAWDGGRMRGCGRWSCPLVGGGLPGERRRRPGHERPRGRGLLERLESFYHERGAAAILSVCPLADRSLLRLLGQRGWQAGDFEHLLVLDLGAGRRSAESAAETDAIEVRVCLPEERAAWAATAARGFSDGATPEQGHKEFGAVMAEREEAILVLAWVDGVPAGTGSLVVDGGVGWLSGDSTLPQYRRRGIQQAIQRHRLRLARDAGCDMAVTEAVPGGASQRNMERLGFRIAYTHVEFTKGGPYGG